MVGERVTDGIGGRTRYTLVETKIKKTKIKKLTCVQHVTWDT